MRARLLAITAASAALTACASSPAQRAFDHGAYASAAKLADEDVKSHPGDEGAIALRQKAREREVETVFGNVETLFRSGRGGAALGMLDHILAEVDEWGGAATVSVAARTRLATTTTKAKMFVAGLADAAQPLAAEAAVEHDAPPELHHDLAAARENARSRVKLAGQKNCARLRGLTPPETPAWNLVVARYCGHFGQDDAPPLTPEAPTLTTTVAVTGLATAETEPLRVAAERWLAASLWSHRLDEAPARAEWAGKLDVSTERHTVTLHAGYNDEIKTETQNPAEGVAGLFPIVSRTKMDRVYEYDAEEKRGSYTFDARVTYQLGRGGPLVVALRRKEDLKAYDHDVTFHPAGVAPVHGHLPSSEAWLARQLADLSNAAVATLNQKFIATFCTRARYTVEEAAGCVSAGVTTPSTLTPLAAALGEKPELLPAVVGPPPIVVPPPPIRAHAVRRRAPRASGAAADAEDPASD
jgi:hypothetical protein